MTLRMNSGTMIKSNKNPNERVDVFSTTELNILFVEQTRRIKFSSVFFFLLLTGDRKCLDNDVDVLLQYILDCARIHIAANE